MGCTQGKTNPKVNNIIRIVKKPFNKVTITSKSIRKQNPTPSKPTNPNVPTPKSNKSAVKST